MTGVLGFVALWLPRLWCLSCLGGCLLVARWVQCERRQRRADVRTARELGYGLFLEHTGGDR